MQKQITNNQHIVPALCLLVGLAILLLLISHHASADHAQQASPKAEYAIVDLGTLGGSESRAVCINNAGQVVGRSEIEKGSIIEHAFVYSGSHMIDLTPGLKSTFSAAFAINAKGNIVGSVAPAPAEQAAKEEGLPFMEACLWTDNSLLVLGDMGSNNQNAQDINDHDQIVGFSEDRPKKSKEHAFLWAGGTATDIGTLGGLYSFAWSINDAGDVVGEADLPSPRLVFDRAFLWRNGVMKDLGTLGGDSSQAIAINNSGQITGDSDTIADQAETVDKDRVRHAFLREANGPMRDLGTLGGKTSSGNGINNSGVVVGWSELSDTTKHACLWQAGQIYDLNSLIPNNSGWVLVKADSINDRGQIVGYGTHGNDTHAFLLTPTK